MVKRTINKPRGVNAAVMPVRNTRRRQPARRGRKNQRGLLGDLGNMFLPGIGGVVGGVADNLLGGLLGGKGGKGSTAPLASAGRMRAQQVNRSTEHGIEQLATISVPAGTPAGTILLQSLIAAPDLGVRLRAFAELWTKTLFKTLVVSVVSSNPSVVGGNYTLAIDPDPAQDYTSGKELPGRLMALTMAERANAWADVTLNMQSNPKPLFNRFHAIGASDAEIREFACGQLIMATTTDYDSDCTYTVNLYWHVQFERPDTTSALNASNFILVTDGVVPVSYTNATGNVLIRVSNGDVWSKLPPTGGYLIDTPLTISIQHVSGSYAQYQITQLAVGPSTTDLLVEDDTVEDINPNLTATLGTQNPRLWVMSTATSGLIKQGYSTVHPWFARGTNHQQWYEINSRAKRVASHMKMVDAALQRALNKQLDSLTLNELRSQAALSDVQH